MVVHTAAQIVEYVSVPTLIGGTVGAAGIWSLKAWAGGRKCTWEREWAGKMIMIVGPPTTTVLSLISTLLRLPSPPQILYLPPLPSPLPQDLLTILHTLRLSTSNPQAQLHCEPLPPTPRGVRDFMRKWASSPQGTVGEGGRRVDAVILAEGWEVMSPKQWGKLRFEGRELSQADDGSNDIGESTTGTKEPLSSSSTSTSTSRTNKQNHSTDQDTDPGSRSKPETDPPWTTSQLHLHLLTSLLPHLLRTPERNIRLITLISPGYAAALPSLQSLNSTISRSSPLIQSGIRGLTSLLVMARFGLILDTLASVTPGEKPVPSIPNNSNGKGGDGIEEAVVGMEKKKKEVNVKSNVMALSVVMPWCRGDVIRGIWGADESWLRWILYMLFFPILLILTPSPSKSTQSILYALSAPVRVGPLKSAAPLQPIQPLQPGEGIDQNKKEEEVEVVDPRRSGIGGGDVVRDCAVIDLPPVLCDPLVAKAHYDKIEKEVEEGVRQSQIREKAFPQKAKSATATATAPGPTAHKPKAS